MKAKSEKRYKTGRDALSEPEVELLLSKIPHLEDDALLRLAISTGIRREDVVAIRLENVDLEKGVIKFWESKKKRTWIAYIGGTALNTLEQHINKLPKGTPWLFPSPRGVKHHVSGRHAYNVLQRHLARVGLRGRPFHALRATCIKLASKRGWKPEEVAELTGDSIEVIQEHYETPSEDEMISASSSRSVL